MTKILLPMFGPEQSILLELVEEEGSENLFLETTADLGDVGPVESPCKMARIAGDSDDFGLSKCSSRMAGVESPTTMAQIEETDFGVHMRSRGARKLLGFQGLAIPKITYVILGNTIYGIGGILNEHLGINRCAFLKDVYCNSAVAPEQQWSPLPPMNVGRAAPLAAVLGGMLYVFGGLSYSTHDPFAEVFDPESRVWKLLPDLGPFCIDVCTARVAMVSHSNSMIVLLHLQKGCLVVFSPRCNTWSLLDFIHPTVVNTWKHICIRPVIFDDTIYYCIHRQLHAWNISREELLSTDIPFLPTDDNDTWFSSLIHMSGLTFYLVWGNHQRMVHLTRFRATCLDTLTVEVISQKHFYLEEDGDDATFADVLMCGVAQD